MSKEMKPRPGYHRLNMRDFKTALDTATSIASTASQAYHLYKVVAPFVGAL